MVNLHGPQVITFTWPVIGKPTWPTVLWPDWLSDDDGKFKWPTPDAFVWPTMPGIDWSLVTWPDWLLNDEGEFEWPDPGPFVWPEVEFVGFPDWFYKGQEIVQTIVDGITSYKLNFSAGFLTIFNWVKDQLFPSSDAKEGPFQQLTATGTAIVETIASGITLGDGVLYDAVSGLFLGLIQSIPLFFGMLLLPNPILEQFDMPVLNGAIRLMTGLWKATDNLGEKTGSGTLTNFADDLAYLNGALVMMGLHSLDSDSFLYTLYQTLALLGVYKKEDDWDTSTKLTTWSDAIFNFATDLSALQNADALEGGTSIEKLSELCADALDRKYENPMTEHLPQNKVYADIFSSIIGGFESANRIQESDDFWKAVGEELKSGWDTYKEGAWLTHRDLIQAGIWKSLTSYAGTRERSEDVTFSVFWAALGKALKARSNGPPCRSWSQ